MPSMSLPINPATALADYSEVEHLGAKLRAVRVALGKGVEQVKPEFGAYMAYSGVLELGSKDGKRAARPHIRPAIEHNATFITAHLLRGWMGLIHEMAKGASPDVKARTQELWTQALNDKPRIEAAANAPYLYGFHRRSIQGYAKPRTENEVIAEQNRAKRAGAALRKKK